MEKTIMAMETAMLMESARHNSSSISAAWKPKVPKENSRCNLQLLEAISHQWMQGRLQIYRFRMLICRKCKMTAYSRCKTPKKLPQPISIPSNQVTKWEMGDTETTRGLGSNLGAEMARPPSSRQGRDRHSKSQKKAESFLLEAKRSSSNQCNRI